MYGNYSNKERYMPSGHLYHNHYNYKSKTFLVLMTRRGNNFGHRWRDALIVCSILPLSFFQKIWHISNEIDLIFVVLCIQPSRTTCCVSKFFHTVDLFNLKWSTWASKGMREKLMAIHLVLTFPKCGYDKYHRETNFKTLLS